MSRLAAADRIQSTEECLTQEGRNTNMNAAEGMQLSSRELVSDAVWRRANKYAFYESEKTPLDTAVEACNVRFLDIFFDCVYLDEQVKTRMVSNAYTNFFHRKFRQITKDHIAMVKRLLELGADVNGGPSALPLSVATKAGSYPLVELLCQHGADLNKRNRTCCYTPLCIAAEGGHYDMIEMMLRFGANVHDAVLTYSTIDLALAHGHINCAKLLLQHGANFDVKRAFCSLTRHQSVANINFLFVDCGHETQQYICKHQQDLLLSAVRGTNIELISHILDIAFDIMGKYPCLEELLVESGNGEIASFLIRKGADVNKLVETSGGYTPVYLVLGREDMCHTPKLQVVKVLLENGASPNICGETSPLMLVALTNNSTDLLRLLLDYGADINWRDNKGDTALSYSVYHGCESNAEFLIRCAKDKHFINSQNNVGLTVLMQAARYSNVAVVKMVINHNPDVNMTDYNGNTALLHAINRFNKNYDYRPDDIVTTLINASCDINLQNNDGLSPLMLAVNRHSKEVVQILLDAGADINAVSKTDRTKTAVSYFWPMYNHDIDITSFIAVFLAQGACFSYLQSKMFHRMLLCNKGDTIHKLIANGTGPITVRSGEYFNNFSPADPTFDISPLCTVLLSGNASLARHFVDIMWLTKSDLTSLTHNKSVCSYLEKKNHTQCLNLLGEMSSQPMSLLKLAFVEVSSAVGTTHGREKRVNKLSLPQLLKDKLLFKYSVDFKIPTTQGRVTLLTNASRIWIYLLNGARTQLCCKKAQRNHDQKSSLAERRRTPTMDRIPFWLIPSDPSSDIYTSVLDCCKCCRVWQNLKFKRQFRNKYTYFTCVEHDCSECFAVF